MNIKIRGMWLPLLVTLLIWVLGFILTVKLIGGVKIYKPIKHFCMEEVNCNIKTVQ